MGRGPELGSSSLRSKHFTHGASSLGSAFHLFLSHEAAMLEENINVFKYLKTKTKLVLASCKELVLILKKMLLL